MGETVLAAAINTGVAPTGVTVVEPRADRAAELAERYGVVGVDPAEAPAAVATADVVFIVVKPQDVAALLAQVGSDVRPDATVVSFAAGVRTATIESAVPAGVAVVRAMPNTPALVGAGVFGLSAGQHCAPERLALIADLLRQAGQITTVDEAHQDALTAVSGSGPAYVFYLAEAMIAGGIEAGLDPLVARDLTIGTLTGAAALLASGEDDPAELRRRVTSPNGTTAAAIATFDAAGVDAALRAGVVAAARRSAELAGS